MGKILQMDEVNRRPGKDIYHVAGKWEMCVSYCDTSVGQFSANIDFLRLHSNSPNLKDFFSFCSFALTNGDAGMANFMME